METKCVCGKGKQYPHLFAPLRVGNIRMKNRIICAPTSPSMIDLNGHFTPEMIAYLEEKAMGGAGVVTYGEAIVHSATGKSHNKQLQLDAFGVRQGMTEAARAIHNAGAFANIQLPWRHVRRTRQRRRGCRYLQCCLWTKRDVHAGGRGKGDAKRFDL